MNDQIVFVIGAGASAEVNLPVGTSLKDEISTLLDIKFENAGTRRFSGDYLLEQSFRLIDRRDINPLLYASWKIRDALPLAASIDNFLDAHSNDEFINVSGKLAIVRAIGEAEKRSLLFVDRRQPSDSLSFDAIKDTWYVRLWRVLSENCGFDDFKERLNSVSFIVFNYDRCLEHFLRYAIRQYYLVSDQIATDLLKKIRFFHPYGKIGDFRIFDAPGGLDFGELPDANKLLSLGKKISTFSEGVDNDHSDITTLRSFVSSANRLVFLGFAYHPMNLDVLFAGHSKNIDSISSISGTTFGISNVNSQQIKKDISARTGIDLISFANETASDFFDSHSRILSLR